MAIAAHMSPIELLDEGKRRMEEYIPKLLDADYGEYPKMTKGLSYKPSKIAAVKTSVDAEEKDEVSDSD
jgi:hypothetical protein